MRVLEIGPNVNPQAHLLPGLRDAEFIYVEINEDVPKAEGLDGATWIYGDARELSKLTDPVDVIFASHVLEHFGYFELDLVLKEWVDCLNDGGSLHIVVPSLEWAAKEILSIDPSKAVLAHLFGGQDTMYNIHLCGFTMRFLRAKLEKAGLAVAHAKTGNYTINILGDLMQAEQHYAAGYKLPLAMPRKE